MQTLSEAFQYSSIRNWRLNGRDGVIKVMNEQAARRSALDPSLHSVEIRGYITQAKYIFGFTSGQIERALGLPPASLASGAFIYAFSRLPSAGEIEFKYSLAWPDGEVPTSAEYRALLDRRDAALQGLTSEPSLYPPGGGHIPQWKLTAAIPGTLIQHVAGADVFMRDKPYEPHNRPVRWGRIL